MREKEGWRKGERDREKRERKKEGRRKREKDREKRERNIIFCAHTYTK